MVKDRSPYTDVSLHLLCREHAMSFILSSTTNLASIQALHILSTWEPIDDSLTSTGQRTEVQSGRALTAAAIAHASTLRLDAAAEFVHFHSRLKDVTEDVRFKAKIVSRCGNPVKRQILMKSVAQPVFTYVTPDFRKVWERLNYLLQALRWSWEVSVV